MFTFNVHFYTQYNFPDRLPSPPPDMGNYSGSSNGGNNGSGGAVTNNPNSVTNNQNHTNNNNNNGNSTAARLRMLQSSLGSPACLRQDRCT